jgi:integrase
VWDRVDRNPVREVRLSRSKATRHVRPLLSRDVEAMRAALLADERVSDATLLTVLAYAGMRPEEARALRWSGVGERTLRIERAVAGGGRRTATRINRESRRADSNRGPLHYE